MLVRIAWKILLLIIYTNEFLSLTKNIMNILKFNLKIFKLEFFDFKLIFH